MSSTLSVLEADLSDPTHQEAIVHLVDTYAQDEFGGGAPLPAQVLERLIDGLRAHPTTRVFLAFVEGKPVGVATCFVGFSTFAARPLLNVHDLGVLPEYRGQGVGSALLAAAEQAARESGYCKLTLEVQEGNARARGVYAKAGFANAVYGEGLGGSLFYSKPL